MGFNGFVCDECGELVDFAGDGEAIQCSLCDQFDLGDGRCYCLSCGQKKEWLTCEGCGYYLCLYVTKRAIIVLTAKKQTVLTNEIGRLLC